MGRTYKHEKDWGRPLKKKPDRKKSKERLPLPTQDRDRTTQEDEYSEYDDLEQKTLDEEFYDRRNRN